MPEFLQFTFSGLTVGAVYALVALGFTLIYNASDVINFAQGEFVMLGGMTTVFLGLAGVPLPLAACLAIVLTVIVGLALHRFAIEPARGASAVVLIIITIGASIFLRGAAQVVFDKRFHSLPPWFGNDAIRVRGRGDSAAEPGGARRRRRHCRAAVGLHRSHLARQGDCRHRGKPACRAPRGHQHLAASSGSRSPFPRRSGRSPAS